MNKITNNFNFKRLTNKGLESVCLLFSLIINIMLNASIYKRFIGFTNIQNFSFSQYFFNNILINAGRITPGIFFTTKQIV